MPYPPPSLTCLSTSLPFMAFTGKALSSSATKRGGSSSASGSKYECRLNELEEGVSQVGDADFNQTCHTLAKYNFAVRDKELTMQREEHVLQLANTETEHQCQVDLRKLDIELKQAEENTVSRQVQLLQLQIELAKMKSTGPHDAEMVAYIRRGTKAT